MRGIKRARALTDRIDIQQKDATEVWQTVEPQIWAELIPLKGSEAQVAQSTRPVASARFRIRFRTSVAAMDTRVTRVLHPSGTYNVTYIEDANNAHVELYIVVEREDP